MLEDTGTARSRPGLPACVESTATVRPVAPSLGFLAGAMAIWGLALMLSVTATLASATTRSPLVMQRFGDIATSRTARPHVSVVVSGATSPTKLDR
jgi:hypothetical protein